VDDDSLTERIRAAVREAEAAGHVVADDSPGGPSSVQRWSCLHCGDAVLRYGETVYGSLVETPRTCEEAQAYWRQGVVGS
jgi:hypothetical protein